MSVGSKIRGVCKLITNSGYRFAFLAGRGLKGDVPGEEFLKRVYRFNMNRELNLDDPVTYTEKLQWLKLYDHRPEYSVMVDKYAAKEFVAERIGAEHVIPLLGVWDSVEDIDFENLPQRFVLKTTHDSGGIVICKDKAKLNITAAKKKLNRFMKREYYRCNREWPYKNVKPRIIAEKYMLNHEGSAELSDYKWFCFDGVARVMFVVTDRQTPGVGTKMDYFDMEFRHLPFTNGCPNATREIEKPVNFERMREMAERISKGLPHVRVDFYEADGQVYFGEITFFDGCGMTPFEPEEWDTIFGSWIQLPEKTLQ